MVAIWWLTQNAVSICDGLKVDQVPCAVPSEQQQGKERRCGHAHCCAQSEARTLLLDPHWIWESLGLFQAQGMLLVSVSELKVADAAWATLNPSGLGCRSDPVAFLSSIRDWYKAQASTAFNPNPPRLNVAAKDNSQGTGAAVGRSALPLPPRCTSPYSVNVISQQTPKTKTSVPSIKAADRCPCVKRPIIPTQSRHLDQMQHAREMNRKSIHGLFLAPSAGTGVGGEQRKGSRDSRTPLPEQIGTIQRPCGCGRSTIPKRGAQGQPASRAVTRCSEIRAKCPSPFPHHR